MIVIVSEILSCLAVATAIGFATAWALRVVSERAALRRLEAVWRGRAQDLEARLSIASESLSEQTDRAAQLSKQLDEATGALRASESSYADAEAGHVGALDQRAVAADVADADGTGSGPMETPDERVGRLREAHDALARDLERIRMLVALREPPGPSASHGSDDSPVAGRSRKSMDALFGVPTPQPEPEHVVSDIESALRSLRDGVVADGERARWLAERIGELGPIAERLHERADALVANGGHAGFEEIDRDAGISLPPSDDPRPASMAIQEEIDGIRALIEQRRSTVDRLESDFAEAALDPGIAGQLVRLETQIERLSGEVSNRDGRIQDLSERMRAAAERKARMLEESERLAAEREHLAAQLRERDDYIDALEVDLQSTSRGQNAEIDSLRRKLTELESAPESPARPAVGIVRSMPDPAPDSGSQAREPDAPRIPDAMPADESRSGDATLPADFASPSAEPPRDDSDAARPGAPVAEQATGPADTRSSVQSADGESRDDLKKVRGIGPVIERMLNGLGVRTFRQIALWTPDDVVEIERHLASFRNRVRRDDWIAHAREQHRIKYGEWP